MSPAARHAQQFWRCSGREQKEAWQEPVCCCSFPTSTSQIFNQLSMGALVAGIASVCVHKSCLGYLAGFEICFNVDFHVLGENHSRSQMETLPGACAFVPSLTGAYSAQTAVDVAAEYVRGQNRLKRKRCDIEARL